ncbi:MAG: hypothetical protein XXXJIFNMEKO3_02731 [Candidatus Erwinia impunctatus]|nr:hypothetical protein XXXJIFNMEKO_02731 [Culicoides impunctatus]
MNEPIVAGNTVIDIDALLQDTWLQVISLRHGPLFNNGEGEKLWEQCVTDIERIQQQLKTQGMDARNCTHILTAQCALLDETVKGRGVEDDACVQWYNIPLQGHFLGTMDAGDTLCDNMLAVLRCPSPDKAVLSCFQRVMLLGFLGSFRSLQDPARQKLIAALSEQLPALNSPSTSPVLVSSPGTTLRVSQLFNWPIRLGLALLVLVALWWGFDSWLDHLLTTLRPEAVQ